MENSDNNYTYGYHLYRWHYVSSYSAWRTHEQQQRLVSVKTDDLYFELVIVNYI